MEISDELAIVIFIAWMCLATPIIMLVGFVLVERKLDALHKYANAARYKFSSSDYRYQIANELEKFQFQLTQHRTSGRASTIFEVPCQGSRMLIFEYKIGSGKGAMTYRVAMIESADLPNFYFHIQQQRLSQKIAPRLGFMTDEVATLASRCYLLSA